MLRPDWHLRANIRLRHLQLLVVLDEMRNLSKVADYMHVTQPAASKTLSSLEADFGCKLFERTARGMEPTIEGECVVRHVRGLLDGMANLRDDLQDLSEGRITRLAMGVLPAVTATLVPEFVMRIEHESPDVAIAIQEGTMDTLVPLLRSGELDLIVGNIPTRPLGLEFKSEVLYHDALVLVVRTGHPLCETPDPTWEDLADFPMMLPPRGTFTRTQIDDLLLLKGVRIPRRHVNSVSTMTNIGILSGNDTVAFMSTNQAQHFEKQGLLAMLPYDLGGIYIQVGLVWMAERPGGKAHQRARELLGETAVPLVIKSGDQSLR